MAGPYNFHQVLVSDIGPGGSVRTLRNGKVTVRSATGIAPADAGTGAVIYNLTSDSKGTVTFTTGSTPVVDLVAPSGFVKRVTSPDALTEAASAATSAANSASAAQASANSSAASAALVGAPAGSAIDAYLGGSASALLDASGNVQSGRSVVRGNNGKRYRVIACAIQNTGAPNYWQPINDTNHNPIVGTVTTGTSTITVNYGFTAAKVATLVVSPDEAMCWKGYEVGASVGLSAAIITLSRNRVTDYVSYNGTTWSSLSNVFSNITFNTSTGVLSLTHDYIGGPVGQVSIRDGNIDAQLGSLGNTTTEVVFRDYAGTKILTPSTAMRVYVTRVGWGSVNPQVSGLGAGENLWIHGLLEV